MSLVVAEGLATPIVRQLTGAALAPVYPALYNRGWHLQGLESFGTGQIPGVAWTDYNPPVLADFNYAKAKGANVLRIGLLWERAQLVLNGPLNQAYLQYLDNCVRWARERGMRLVLDPCHGTGEASGGRYVGGTIYKVGSTQVSISAWTDYLVKIYQRYGNDTAIYAIDVSNEPINLPVPTTPGNYDTSKTQVQYIPNWSFESSLTGWSPGSTFTRSTERTQKGSYSVKQQTTAAGTYDNFTTENDTASGIQLAAGTYTLSLYYLSTITSGNPSVIQINTDNAYGTNLAQDSFAAAASWTRKAVTFTVPAGGARVYVRIFDNGGIVTNFYDAFNLTAGSTAGAYIDSYFTGAPYATNTLMHQAAINALRGVGCTYWIWLETEVYSGPHNFFTLYGDNPNVWWSDPLGKTALSFHYYLDPDHSGAYTADWTQATRDRQAGEIDPVNAWGAAKGVRITYGETGVPSDSTTSSANYRTDEEAFYQRADTAGQDVLWFAAGQQFSSRTSIQSVGGVDVAAMSVVLAHLGK